MLSTAAKKKSEPWTITVQSLSDAELAELIEEVRAEADARLDALAEQRRPKGEIGSIPASTFRLISWGAKAGGNIFESFLLAAKEGQ